MWFYVLYNLNVYSKGNCFSWELEDNTIYSVPGNRKKSIKKLSSLYCISVGYGALPVTSKRINGL